jgi:hypothetical protein
VYDFGSSFERRFAMRRLLIAVSTTALLMFFSAGSALATSGAHFMSATDSVNSSGALVVNWDEAGLGQQTVNYTLSTDASATYACLNGGGNHPKAANKVTFHGPLASPNTGFKPDNGRVQGTLSVGPLSAGSFTCPSGQTLVLASVSYSNIVLTDTTNNVSTTFPDISRIFFAV